MSTSILDLLSMTPQTLAAHQHTALNHALLTKLEKLVSLIKSDAYDEALAMYVDSPAGDGYGCENRVLDCSDLLPQHGPNNYDPRDVADVLDKLKQLRALSVVGQKQPK